MLIVYVYTEKKYLKGETLMKTQYKILSLVLAILAVLLIFTGTIIPQINKVGLDRYEFTLLPKSPTGIAAPTAVTKSDFWITLRDGVRLDCSKFIPNQSPVQNYMTVIMVHGYGDNKDILASIASAQASYGYTVYTFSVRGQGNSGGLSNLISTVEAQDLIEVVNNIRKDSYVDTAKILIMGGSQGGILPYMANSMGGLNVKTIISGLASPEFATSWIENGCVKMTLLWTASYTSDIARYTPQVNSLVNWIYSNAADKWDSIAYWFPKGRDFTSTVKNCKVPIMLENGWQDKFFNVYGNIKNIPVMKAPSRYYFGAVRGHGGDYSLTEDTWHENFFNEWFYYWLFGIDNGILTRPKYHFAYTTYPQNVDMWSFVHDSSSVWTPSQTSDLKIYISPNGLPGPEPGPGPATTGFATLKNTVSAGLTMQQAVDLEFTGSGFTSKFTKSSLNFETPVLTENIKLLGTPVADLDFTSTALTPQFNIQIYEVTPGTPVTTKLVNRINYTDRKYIKNKRKLAYFSGMSQGHIFQKGHKIRITITNLDTAPEDVSFMGTNPHVLPSLNNGAHKIYYTSKSYVSLPVLNKIAPSANLVASVQGDNNSETAYSFKLEQNYPNPFNPVTRIDYSLLADGNVTIIVYDISGRKIASLVNDYKTSGLHSVNFDASGISSGIYFYKIESGNFSAVKKMMLIK